MIESIHTGNMGIGKRLYILGVSMHMLERIHQHRYIMVFGCLILLSTMIACGGNEGSNRQVSETDNNVTGKWGYIDKAGNIVIEPQFPSAREFSEGLAFTSFGYIDRNGEVKIENRFGEARSFSEGVAAAMLDEEFGYIDRSGTFVIKPRFDEAGPFKDGLARVSEKGGKYGYIDRTGEYEIEPKFDNAGDFSEGLARVVTGPRSTETLRGFINSNGEYMIQPELAGIDASDNRADFFEGKALFVQKEWQGDYLQIKHGFIDKAGTVVIESIYDFADHFSEGYAAVNVEGRWGYIDSIGNMVIEPQFEEAGIFSEGLAAIEIDGKWGYIDKSGKVVIEPQFTDACSFSEGLAPVMVR
jgi:hypothetical protein